MQPQAHPWTDGRLMSFAMTTTQLVDGTKTVTRRHGWKNLKVGARLRAVHKAMGLEHAEVTVIEFRVVWRPGAAQVGLYAQQEARP